MKFQAFASRPCSLILISLLLPLLAPAADKTIRLRNPNVGSEANAGAQSPPTAPASGLFIVQFREPLREDWRTQLRQIGVDLLRYVPDDAFVARFRGVRPADVSALQFVQCVEDYLPRQKVESRLEERVAGQPGKNVSVLVLLSPRADPGEVSRARQRLARFDHQTALRSGRILRGTISPAQLEALAAQDAVLWIESAPRMTLYDEISSRIVAGDGPGHQTLMQSLGYNGTGVTVAVADSGLDSGDTNSMHPDIQGRVTALFYYGTAGQLDDAADEHGHGTHCAGIIAGNGAVGETDPDGYLYGLGVAPGASLIGQRIFDAVGGYAPPPSFETLTRNAKQAGADIGSNSWGDDTQGQYDLSAMEFDALVRDADLLTFGDQPYILEFSAGNAGPGGQTVGSPAVAKNVIATGASQNDRSDLPIEEFAIYADGQDAMADFSSRGPSADGRIKPDLTAPGTWIASLRSVYANDDFAWWPISDNYFYEGGTSQAGPHVSGAAAVFVQYWRTTHTNETPSPALVKAALINSATDMNDGSTTVEAVPNNDEGWGRVNLPALIGSTRQYDFVDQTSLLTNHGVFEKRVLIGSANEPLKITLAYTDVPGFPGAAAALVNDLDLEVISPTGDTYRGNRFADGESVANAPLADTINNVEGVHLSSPVPGEYVVRVRATRVVEDARHDSPATDQDFALVISGAFSIPGEGIVTFDRRVYRAPDQIRLTLVDYDLAGQPSATVQLRSGTESLGESYALFANGSTGLFTNTIATATGSAGVDGVLQVAHNDLIEAVYADAAPASNRLFTAQVDLQPPVISDLDATNRLGQVAVRWNTDEAARGEVYYGSPTPNLALTNRLLDISQEIALLNIAPGAEVKYFVVAQDEAGNRTTNDNGGAFFTVTNTFAPRVLLLDSYTDYSPGFIDAPPLSGYTNALDALGTSYDVFDARSGAFPTLGQLQLYRCVIWRTDELVAPDAADVALMADYVTNGGSLFIASMEFLTRLGEAGAASFGTDILQVQSHTEDQPVDNIAGFANDPVGAGINTNLDYTPYADLFSIGITDPSDWIAPTTNATPVLLADGETVGLRAPKTGVDLPGRVVFLSFPLDAVPLGSGIGNNRAGLLQNILNFLAPEPNASSITLNSDVYSLPGLAVMEVEDLDQSGLGSVGVTVGSPEHTNTLNLALAETARPGLFRGNVLLSPTNSAAPNVYTLAPNDTVQVDYFDASAGQTRSATATIDTNAPLVSSVFIEPGYLEAFVSWETSKDADALVQYGESPGSFPNNYTAYDPSLTTTHEVFLSGLKPNTTYYLRVTSRDRAGNVTVDDNAGAFYAFTTLQPLTPPWFDNLETNNPGWSVITSEGSESEWTWGTPGGGQTAYSGTNVWGSLLNGGSGVSLMESYLVSPGILLTGGNRATLRFHQNYDFLPRSDFEFQLAALEIITNITTSPIVLHQFPEDFTGGWEEFQIELSPYLGKVVYIVWYHFLFSFDPMPRLGWLVDDVSIDVESVVPGTIQITNNLWQAVFALSGPTGLTGKGRWLEMTNAPAGQYVIQYGDALYHTTPPPQTNTLAPGGTLTFFGNYTTTDLNTNQIPDAYEVEHFGGIDPLRTLSTDTDLDGLSDRGEYVAGTDPNNPPPPFRLATRLLPGHLLQIAWHSVTNHTYRVHASPDGIAWAPDSGWIAATGTNTSYTLDTTTNGASRFFRVEAAPPTDSVAATFRVSVAVLPDDQIRLSWPTAPGHGYLVLGSTNAVDWIPMSDWLRVSGYIGNYTLPAPTNGAPYLFRVEAQP